VLYFSVFDWPADGRLVAGGIREQVQRASLLAGGVKLQTEMGPEGLIVHVPAAAPDTLATVIKVELN
jgi:alpha-L-fucosidase